MENNKRFLNGFLPVLFEYIAIFFINITVSLFAVLKTYNGAAISLLFYFIIPSIIFSVLAALMKFRTKQNPDKIIKGNIVFYVLNLFALIAFVAGISFLSSAIALRNNTLFIVFGSLTVFSSALFCIAILVNKRDERAELFRKNRRFICFDICSAFNSLFILSSLFYIVFIEYVFLIFSIVSSVLAFAFFILTLILGKKNDEKFDRLKNIKLNVLSTVSSVFIVVSILLSALAIAYGSSVYTIIACVSQFVAFTISAAAIFFNVEINK